MTSAPPNHGTTISARVVDNAGNVGPVTTVTVQRDTQAPNAPSVTLGGFSGVPPWNPTTVSYAHNGDNGPSGVNRIECSINGGTFLTSVRIYTRSSGALRSRLVLTANKPPKSPNG